MAPLTKPSAATRRLVKHQARQSLKAHEATEKAKVRKRDGYRCRFPLCGCHALKLRLEVAHLHHKGIGGNPKGDRSTAAGMVLLCVQRHQDGLVSWHHGTLRAVPLTPEGANGNLQWEVREGDDWIVVAVEIGPWHISPLTGHQAGVLTRLGKMAE